MKTVLIIGAGATLAESLSSYPSQAKKPPLDITFFNLCRLSKITGRNAVKFYMMDNYGIDPFSHGYPMEEVFNYLYSDVHSVKSPPGCLSAYWSLVQMYTAAIAKTTNPYYGKSRYGVGSLLRNIVKKDPMGEITFITFNQDLIIEKSIQYSRSHKSYKSLPWNIKLA